MRKLILSAFFALFAVTATAAPAFACCGEPCCPGDCC